MSAHTMPVRIYYEDTDAGGVVYHANYLKFGERARSEFLRHIHHQCSTLAKDLDVLFVVKHIDVEYIRPAFLDDLLEVKTTITELKNSSFRMRHVITKAGEFVCDLYVTLVCVEADTIKPVRVPEILRRAFENLIDKDT
jgi:acyl-CoA thioester hydrolase